MIAGPVSGYTWELLRRIERHGGIRVRVLHDPPECPNSHGHDHFEADDIESLAWRKASVAQLRAFIRDPRPRAVLVWGVSAPLPFALAALALPRSVPFAFTGDMNVAALAARPLRTLRSHAAFRLLLRRIDVGLSLGLTNRLAFQLLGAPRIADAPFYAVDFGALDAAFDAAEHAIQPTPQSGDRATLLVIARLVPEKNLVAAIRALGADEGLAQRVQLVIAGEGPERPAIERAIAAAPQLRVELLGAVAHERVGGLFARADALWLPSILDQWGIVVVEALGMGVPVISTPVAGAAISLAGATQAVMLSADTSAAAIADSVRRYLANRDRLRVAARASREHVRERYDQSRAAARIVEVMEEVARELRG